MRQEVLEKRFALNETEIIKNTRIGVVGGGQLALMMGEAARTMGFETFKILDPTPNCPAGSVANGQIVADFKDEVAICELARQVDVVTFEIELANSNAFGELASSGKEIHPTPETLRVIQDKLTQKRFLHDVGIPVAPFYPLDDPDSLARIEESFGFPFIVKARRDAYDGRGNVQVNSLVEMLAAMEKFKDRTLYVEQYVPFVKELAVMVARNTKGEITVYPVVETIHQRHICHIVIAPAQISENAACQAKNIATKVVESFSGAGVFGIEMFLTPDGQVLINEIAPRVHNSGHYTIEACHTSQFEQHLRAICGLPLGPTEMVVPAAVMINILGERDGPTKPRVQGLMKDGTYIHLYGKHETRWDRKMGHITVLGQDVQSTLQKAISARRRITI